MANEVRELLGAHLRRRGWELDAHGQDCHGAGWLLDRTTICVGVHVRDGTVYVSFEGSRAWPWLFYASADRDAVTYPATQE